MSHLLLAPADFAGVRAVGEASAAFMGARSPRHTLEHASLRQSLCAHVVATCRELGLAPRGSDFPQFFLRVLERVYEEIRELETLELFLDVAGAALRIQQHLADFLHQKGRLRAAFPFP